MQLDGKIALVTGAGSGIGKSTALLFAKEGATVGILGRTASQLQQVADEIKSAGGKAIVLQADVSKSDQMKTAIETLGNQFGRIDVVFANAGINGTHAPFELLEEADWDELVDINLKGTFLTFKFAYPFMRQNGGSIIVDSSINGTRVFSNVGFSIYATTKAGQVAFAKMMALELSRERIRVNVICPGWILTEIVDNTRNRGMEKIPRMASYPVDPPLTGGKGGLPEQVAQLVLFLASDLSSHITGTEVWIDGGQSLLEG